jgi:hypothetical protein
VQRRLGLMPPVRLDWSLWSASRQHIRGLAPVRLVEARSELSRSASLTQREQPSRDVDVAVERDQQPLTPLVERHAQVRQRGQHGPDPTRDNLPRRIRLLLQHRQGVAVPDGIEVAV